MDNTNNFSEAPSQPTTNIDPVSTHDDQGLQERLSGQVVKQPKPKSKSRLGLIITIVIILVIIGVGGWWYYAQGQALLLNYQLKWNWTEVDNFKSDTVITVKITDIKASDNSLIPFSVDAGLDLSADMTHQVVGQGFMGQSNYYLTNHQDLDTNFGLEYKKIGEDIYFKANLGILDEIFIGTSLDLGDQWILFDKNSFDNMLLGGNVVSQPNANKPKVSFNEKFGNFMIKTKKLNAFSVSDTRESRQTEEGTLKKLKYKVKDKKVKDLVLLYVEEMGNAGIISDMVPVMNSGQAEVKEQRKQELEKFINEKPEEWARIKNYFKQTDLFLWINTKTKNFQGAELVINDMAVESDGGSFKLTANASYTFEATEPVNIIAPRTYMSLEQLIGMLMGAFMPDMMMSDMIDENGQPINPGLDTDGDGLPDIAEDVYGTDPNNPDSDGDGYDDGTEVENGYNPLGEGALEPGDVDFFGYNDSMAEMMLTDAKSLCEYTEGAWIFEGGIDEMASVLNKCLYASQSVCDTYSDCEYIEEDQGCVPIVCQCPEGKEFINGCE